MALADRLQLIELLGQVYFPGVILPSLIGGGKGWLVYYEENGQKKNVILVPSALAGLTALFGMGRGDPRRYSHLKVLAVGY
jgi:hypothetical protein